MRIKVLVNAPCFLEGALYRIRRIIFYWGFSAIATIPIFSCKYFSSPFVPQGGDHIPIGAGQFSLP